MGLLLDWPTCLTEISVKAQTQRSAAPNAVAGWVVAIAIAHSARYANAFMLAAGEAWMPTGASSITTHCSGATLRD
uniref:Uncharacterized protein n=1 Tax=Moorena producens (strain JHB) TaxID=1454205 RepID=A0A1D9G055_MOOP1